MFSVEEKREIADKVQRILRETLHPELPEGEIQFSLHVDGAASWSWADIRNNGAVTNPSVNPWNELQKTNSSMTESIEKTVQEIFNRYFPGGAIGVFEFGMECYRAAIAKGKPVKEQQGKEKDSEDILPSEWRSS
jgi:hypothetical protein